MPEAGRYRFCPMCQDELTSRPDPDGIARVVCGRCGWTYFPSNVLGVNVVLVTAAGELVVLLPPGEPPDAPAALPGGVVEYGEPPEAAAVREAYEETGLRAEVVRELGRWFDPTFSYGPMLSIMFEARVLGGQARSSHEGEVLVVHPSTCPGFRRLGPEANVPMRHGHRTNARSVSQLGPGYRVLPHMPG